MHRSSARGHGAPGRRGSRTPQRGVALVAMLLVLLLAGGVVMVDHLNERVAGRVENAQPTAQALSVARTALVAYASTDANRPGELPCPDFNRDGVLTVADFSGSNCRVLRGWLPWRTLDLPDLRDASGARLWYALSDAYHANGTTALNPDTAGGLSLDGAATPDLVAVLIAPGAAAAGQARPTDGDGPQADLHVDEYLEGANADGSTLTFVSQGGADFNDRVLQLPRTVLMDAVQKRVAAEVARVLEQHLTAHGRYPWLSAFEPPATSNFTTDFGTTSGQLAFTTTAIAEPAFSFDTALGLTWTAGDADRATGAPVIVSSDPAAVAPHFVLPASSEATMAAQNDQALDGGTWDEPYPTTAGGGVTCNWGGTNQVVDCDPFTTASFNAGYSVTLCRNVVIGGIPQLLCQSVPVTRHYEFDLNYEGAVTGWSSNDFVRVRTVADSDGMTVPGDDTIVRAVDTAVLPPLLPFFSDTGTFSITSTLTVQDGDSSTFQVARLYTEPQAPGPGGNGDFPAWFAENGWARYIYVTYAGGYSPTGSGSCTPGTDCVSVTVADGASTWNDVNGAVVMSGELGAGQGLDQPTPGGAGFEEDNANADPLDVERKPPVVGFNDRVRLTSCVSGACR